MAASIKNGVSRELEVQTADIPSYQITTAKIATSAVTANEIASNAVTLAKIATSIITMAKVNYTSVLATIDTVVTTVTHSLGASPSVIIFEPTADPAGKDVYTSSKNATTGIFIAKTASWSGNIIFIV